MVTKKIFSVFTNFYRNKSHRITFDVAIQVKIFYLQYMGDRLGLILRVDGQANHLPRHFLFVIPFLDLIYFSLKWQITISGTVAIMR